VRGAADGGGGGRMSVRRIRSDGHVHGHRSALAVGLEKKTKITGDKIAGATGAPGATDVLALLSQRPALRHAQPSRRRRQWRGSCRARLFCRAEPAIRQHGLHVFTGVPASAISKSWMRPRRSAQTRSRSRGA